eukprot:Rmarinus@m.6234
MLKAKTFQRLQRMLAKLMRNKNASAFNQPVDIDLYPDYYRLIAHPMDFSTIRGKVQTKAYQSLKSFFSDIQLVFSNCRTYNLPGSEIWEQSIALEEVFQAAARELCEIEEADVELPLSAPTGPRVKKCRVYGWDDYFSSCGMQRLVPSHYSLVSAAERKPGHDLPDPAALLSSAAAVAASAHVDPASHMSGTLVETVIPGIASSVASAGVAPVGKTTATSVGTETEKIPSSKQVQSGDNPQSAGNEDIENDHTEGNHDNGGGGDGDVGGGSGGGGVDNGSDVVDVVDGAGGHGDNGDDDTDNVSGGKSLIRIDKKSSDNGGGDDVGDGGGVDDVGDGGSGDDAGD